MIREHIDALDAALDDLASKKEAVDDANATLSNANKDYQLAINVARELHAKFQLVVANVLPVANTGR
jgi:prefoldin subunit 5